MNVARSREVVAVLREDPSSRLVHPVGRIAISRPLAAALGVVVALLVGCKERPEGDRSPERGERSPTVVTPASPSGDGPGAAPASAAETAAPGGEPAAPLEAEAAPAGAGDDTSAAPAATEPSLDEKDPCRKPPGARASRSGNPRCRRDDEPLEPWVDDVPDPNWRTRVAHDAGAGP